MDSTSIAIIFLGASVTLFGILILTWGLNFQFTSAKIQILAKNLKERVNSLNDMERYYVEYYDLLHYHNPFLLKTWFGFKHWFKPYVFDDIFEKYSDEM